MAPSDALSLDRLVAAVRSYTGKISLDVIERAFMFARDAHEGQLRKSGVPYLTHTFATALKLAEWKMPPELIAAGLLHDVPEDTKHTIADLEKHFGKDIAAIVEGETKLSNLEYQGRARYAENLRRMFLAIAKDIRVIIVKFADRIHNLETLDALAPEKQKRIAVETLDIYAPIANRLGMGAARGELEDIAFKFVLPKEYAWVTRETRDRIKEREKYLERVKKLFEADLRENDLSPVSLHGRTKHLYSLYKKLLTHDKNINKIYDLVALRVVVPTVADCYASLGILHQRWKPLKGRIKDYIAQPKPNGYQSLHTTVFCEDGECMEFQFRTPEMHAAAEFGIAAHWQYTEAEKKSRPLDAREVAWLKELSRIQQELHDPNKFLEHLETLKIDIFQNRIFVFTPKGDVIDLPERATPIDVAYAVHTEIGNHCSGAKVNDQMVSLDTELRSGDLVEIITDKNRKGPSPNWLRFAVTHNARDKIKTASKGRLTEWLKQVVSKIERK